MPKLIMPLLLTVLLAACYPVSTQVAAMGLREQYQYQEGRTPDGKMLIGVREAPMVPEGKYFSVRRDDANSTLLELYTVDAQGKVDVVNSFKHKHAPKLAPVTSLDEDDYAPRRYRQPLGYAGLPLLAVTVPAETLLPVGEVALGLATIYVVGRTGLLNLLPAIPYPATTL